MHHRLPKIILLYRREARKFAWQKGKRSRYTGVVAQGVKLVNNNPATGCRRAAEKERAGSDGM